MLTVWFEPIVVALVLVTAVVDGWDVQEPDEVEVGDAPSALAEREWEPLSLLHPATMMNTIATSTATAARNRLLPVRADVTGD